jgi:two-component system CheB/CheR fusion protein
MVIFARHNLVADPPFTRMDLVSCRNALIYLQPPAQERALRRLQYALRLEGCLFLGPSESLGPVHGDFVTLRSREKLYRLARRSRLAAVAETTGRHRRAHDRRHAVALAERAAFVGHNEAAAAAAGRARWVDAGRRCLLQSYSPPTLLIGAERELLHVFGDASDLLQIGEGQATLDVVKLLPREMAWAASLVLQGMLAPGAPPPDKRSGPVKLHTEAGEQLLVLVARRLPPEPPAEDPVLVLLSFEPASRPVADGPVQVEVNIAQQQLVERLEADLARTRESLQATIEELEASNEELQATNEEMMASNEELQSTNEELQSVNEELYTVNAEYQEKVDLLNSVNADLENVSKAAAIPTVFVDESLRLTRITPEAALLFKVRDVDIGRSIEDFAHTLDYPELFSDLRRIIDAGVACEREVRSRNGDWWLARLHPYAGHSTSSSRAVMTFFNITSVRDSQRLQAIVDSLPEHLAVLNAQGTILLVNEAWRRFAAANGDVDLRASGPGSNYLQVCANAALGAAADADAARAHAGMQAVLAGQQAIFTMTYPCHTATEQRWFLMHVAPVGHPEGGAVVSHIDVTAWAPAAALRAGRAAA